MRSNSDKAYLKKWREDRWYGGNREACIQRDKGICVRCGKTGNVVHHKDFKGRGYLGDIDNRLSNLETVCVGCHRTAHAHYIQRKLQLYVAYHWEKPDRELARMAEVSAPTIRKIRKEVLKKIGK